MKNNQLESHDLLTGRTKGKLWWSASLLLLAALTPRAQAQCTGTWLQRTPATSPSPRQQFAMAYDSDRRVTVLFGGSIAAGQSNETWEWDGTNWTQKLPANMPSARALTSMAYDSARHVTVLFGGAESSGTNTVTFDDTWEWNGTNWTRRNPSVSPLSRAAQIMAFDSRRGVTVLFGGLFINSGGDISILGDTWEWDGTAWTQKFSITAPPGSAAQGICFDTSRGVSVLFGGLIDLASLVSDDTFEWDGTNWSQRIPAIAPPGRDQQAMAFDSLRNVTVLFGGADSTFTALGDTWEWDGTAWQLRTPAAPPSARIGASAAFDSSRAVTVMFGGADGVGTLLDETWEWSGPGPFITQQPANLSVAAGQSASFTVAAGGPAPLTFLWRKNGVALSNGGTISGAATATLTVNPVASSDAGSYDVVVSNLCGQIVSRAVSLDTCKASDASQDCDGNGILDSCDIAANPALDTDSNGVIDACDAGPGGQMTPAVPCGLCGGGTATMMPMALWFMGFSRRRHPSPRKPA